MRDRINTRYQTELISVVPRSLRRRKRCVQSNDERVSRSTVFSLTPVDVQRNDMRSVRRRHHWHSYPGTRRSCRCWFHRDAYSPLLFARSSSCVPRSAMRPSCPSTKMQSQCRTVVSRCAIITTVRGLLRFWSSRPRKVRTTSVSVFVSSADVASSARMISGSCSSTRAMATRCFSPPESFSPRSPTTVSYPSSNRDTASCTRAASAAASTSASVASRRP
mmetsp:Transcript_38426/g.118769  ORF Transcript_38426/g.118769 Transcript_38426/m.118769 type:complete len:220 (-) Transcript_38426:394-1053(-)